MKRILTLLLLVSSFMMMGQVTKTSGVLYTSGNPKTNKVVSLIRKSLSKNSEIVVDQSTGDLYTYKRTDSTFVQATRPYKVYTALLTQTDTFAPVATVLENTLGDTIIWVRNYQGSYNCVLSSSELFLQSKTAIFIGATFEESVGSGNARRSSNNNIILNTFSEFESADGELTDSLIKNAFNLNSTYSHLQVQPRCFIAKKLVVNYPPTAEPMGWASGVNTPTNVGSSS